MFKQTRFSFPNHEFMGLFYFRKHGGPFPPEKDFLGKVLCALEQLDQETICRGDIPLQTTHTRLFRGCLDVLGGSLLLVNVNAN